MYSPVQNNEERHVFKKWTSVQVPMLHYHTKHSCSLITDFGLNPLWTPNATSKRSTGREQRLPHDTDSKMKDERGTLSRGGFSFICSSSSLFLSLFLSVPKHSSAGPRERRKRRGNTDTHMLYPASLTILMTLSWCELHLLKEKLAGGHDIPTQPWCLSEWIWHVHSPHWKKGQKPPKQWHLNFSGLIVE